ncbi:hypothetical protein DPMN_033220 [Dreissena polymorpha]|uniref:Uncharacterized protein n=1 Tax=Dreissena polymorpha TaxID=45954 RepID=A0A9D4M817_DREPO|nr:hypothetical protein DPMN_033220 [Dreissena polymorpha]
MFSLYTYRENCPAPPPGGHFHEDFAKIVTPRVFTRKTAPPPGGYLHEDWASYVTSTVFELSGGIIGTNFLTKFHEDWTRNVASRVFTRQNVDDQRRTHDGQKAIPKAHHVSTLCSGRDKNLLKPNWTINVACRVLTRKNAPPLVAIYHWNNLLTKFHDDLKINVTSRPRPPSGHVFQPTGIIFELIQDIIGMNLLTKFHEDRTINVASTVKNAPPLGGHVFQANVTIFELIQDIIKTNLLSKFHEDRKINVASRVLTRKNALPPGGHVFQPTGIIFELDQDIIGMNLLTKFYEDQTINVASRVLTRFYYSHIRKNAPPLGSNVFQANATIFELIQDIIETNLLTKFHEDKCGL